MRRGLPGDTVRARVTKVKRGFAEATALEVLTPGPDRVVAPCPHFGACGGCRFQDYAYEQQLESKAAQVRDALVRLGGIAEPPIDPIVPAASQYHYRNKLEYSFTQTPDGPALGFHRAGRWDEVLPLEVCLLTSDLGNAIRDAVQAWAREEKLIAYDQSDQKGYLRHLVFREGRNTGQVLVQLVTAKGKKFEEGYLVEVLRRFPEVRSIHWAVNETPAEITNLPTVLLWGEDAIEEEILGLRFRVRPNAFLQTNTEMAETLYSIARDFAALTGSETVYDLYCGTGTIGLALAPDALTVWGVEISEESVACAIENAELNGITNAAFFAGNVSLALEELRERAGAAGCRRRRPSTCRARRKGAAAPGTATGAAHRLRLVQPDDARIRPEDAAGGLRLRARSLPPGRHVSAHAAHRDGEPARARRTGARRNSIANPVGEMA